MVIETRGLCLLVLSLLVTCSFFVEAATTGKHSNNGNGDIGMHKDNRNDHQGEQTILQTAKEVMDNDKSFLKGTSSVVTKQSSESDLQDLEPLERLYRLLGDYLMCRFHKRLNCESEMGEKSVQGLKDHLPPRQDWHADGSKDGVLHDRLDNLYDFIEGHETKDDRPDLSFPWHHSNRFHNKMSPNGLLSGVRLPMASSLHIDHPGQSNPHGPMNHADNGPIGERWGRLPFMANHGDSHHGSRKGNKPGDAEFGVRASSFRPRFMMQPWQRNTVEGTGMFEGGNENAHPSMAPMLFGPNML